MSDSVFDCRACRDDRREFTVPADEDGAALMAQHLDDAHGLDPYTDGASVWHVGG